MAKIKQGMRVRIRRPDSDVNGKEATVLNNGSMRIEVGTNKPLFVFAVEIDGVGAFSQAKWHDGGRVMFGFEEHELEPLTPPGVKYIESFLTKEPEKTKEVVYG